MFVTSKVLSTNPSATILSRTLIVNFKRNDRLVSLQYSIDSFHEHILQYCPESVEIISRKGQLGVDSPLAHKCGLVPQGFHARNKSLRNCVGS
jgi:hypothetical protein